jgi:hypothetical protein
VSRIVALLFAAVVAFAQRGLERTAAPHDRTESILYFPSGEKVKRLWAGFEGLGADIYWLRTVQYYGGQRAFAKDKRFDLLAPLLDITVTLDPRFDIAYKYGAIFLAERKPLGAQDPKAAIALLERGIAAMPESWRMRQHLGYCAFVYLRDSRKAASVLREAAKLPGAPFWLETVAAQFLAKGGERVAARTIWTDLYQRATTESVKLIAQVNLKRLDAMAIVDEIGKRVDVFRQSKGRFPQSLDELVTAGLLPKVPKDPAGVPFDYDPETGKVTIARQSELWGVELPGG